jgi:hypothetical protein
MDMRKRGLIEDLRLVLSNHRTTVEVIVILAIVVFALIWGMSGFGE